MASMLRWRRRPRIALQYLAVVFAALSLFLLALPPDHPIILSARLATHKFLSHFPSLYNNDKWIFRPSQFPVDMHGDIATILKTGYGTWNRLPAQLEALGWALNETRGQGQSIMVVGDYSSHFQSDQHDFSVHDMLAAAEGSDALYGMERGNRLELYHRLNDAIRSGEDDVVHQLNREHGWELDAMKVSSPPRGAKAKHCDQRSTNQHVPVVKFIPALERAWKVFPRKKWYLMLDDDTYVIWPSLQLLLGHLDPSKPLYVGNAVGDYRKRFAHGGSAIVISGEAMRRLFDHRPDVVRAVYVDSLTEKWGDRLLAQAFLKLGIYIEERYSRFFNGERPRTTRITAEKFCAPLSSFHALARPGQMLEVGEKFRGITTPVFWGQLWRLYGQPDFRNLQQEDAISEGADHVGILDERVTTKKKVKSPEKCFRHCNHLKSCLAWRWEHETKTCHLAPWFIIGGENGSLQSGVSSGVHIARAKKLQEKCQRRGVMISDI